MWRPSTDIIQIDEIRELMRQSGVEGCGGATRGVDALLRAATNKRTDIMTILMDAGVVVYSVGEGFEVSVKTLLQQHKGETAHGDYAYLCGYARPFWCNALGV